ncbi:MAG: hypothetical protein IT306_01965 [Chloroflexi bacterium]|nr:hypothetical protein [Chloroflexota bacterium]
MIVLGVLAGLVAAAIVVHLAKPLVENHWLTAAQFFRVVNPARTGPLRLGLGNPLRAPAFYLRLPMVLLLLAAALSSQETIALDSGPRAVGAWLLVDTSASMSTLQDGAPRAERVRGEVDRLLTETARGMQAASGSDGLTVCWRLSAFDLERRDLLLATRQPDELRRRLTDLQPRALGTDLGILRRLLEEPPDPQAACQITHLVVIADQPAPDWIARRRDLVVIWQDVGQPVPQRGFASLRPLVNPLTGDIREIGVEVRAFGPPPAASTLVVTAPDGSVSESAARWEADGRWYEPLRPTMPGLYTLRLDPPDAYTVDDTAVVEAPASGLIRVDWQLADRRWPERLRWQPETVRPNLRAVPATLLDARPPDDVPTLLVGDGYLLPPASAAPTPIQDFVDSSPLLDDLNFDVLETLTPAGSVRLPAGFRPILRQGAGRVWLAQRERPAAVYIAGLPPDSTDDRSRVALTVFFNAVRQLLRDRPIPPAYELTSPANPIPEGKRIALHEGEGNTMQTQRSQGNSEDLLTARRDTREPRWPLLLALAAGLFLLERLLAAYGGRTWR